MKVLKKLFEFTSYIGFVLFLFLLSFLISSLFFFSHELNTINRSVVDEIYQSEKIEKINIYGEEQICIEVWFDDNIEYNEVIEYAYHYYDVYQLPVQLIDYTNLYIITISKEGILTSQKL